MTDEVTAIDVLRRVRERQIAEQEGAASPPDIKVPKARRHRRRRAAVPRKPGEAKGCRKIRYASPKKARIAMRHASNRVHVYFCRECAAWHVSDADKRRPGA